ncbi:hypothetical protein ACWESM_14435 [Nocardia sp. NPDC003999]
MSIIVNHVEELKKQVDVGLPSLPTVTPTRVDISADASHEQQRAHGRGSAIGVRGAVREHGLRVKALSSARRVGRQ